MDQFGSDGRTDEYRIPVLKLPNLRDLLQTFGSSIQRVNASGSTMENDIVDEIPEYGFQVEEKFINDVSFNYVRERNTHGEVTNPLTDEIISDINSMIHQTLATGKVNNKNIMYDIPVSRLIVEIDNDIVRGNYEAPPEELFYYDFHMESVESFSGDFKDQLTPLFEKRNLREQKFNWRVPVLHQIIPQRGLDIGGNNHEPIWSWDMEDMETTPLKVTTSMLICGSLPKDLVYNKEVEMVNDSYWSL